MVNKKLQISQVQHKMSKPFPKRRRRKMVRELFNIIALKYLRDKQKSLRQTSQTTVKTPITAKSITEFRRRPRA